MHAWLVVVAMASRACPDGRLLLLPSSLSWADAADLNHLEQHRPKTAAPAWIVASGQMLRSKMLSALLMRQMMKTSMVFDESSRLTDEIPACAETQAPIFLAQAHP